MSVNDDMPQQTDAEKSTEESGLKGRNYLFYLISLIIGIAIGAFVYSIYGTSPPPNNVTDVSQYQDQIANLQGEVETKSEQIIELNGQISELEQELSDTSSEIEGLKSEIARLEAELTESQMRFAELENELETLQKQLTELENAVPPEEGELAKLKGDLAAKSEQIDQLQDKITELEGELDIKNKRIAELESQLATEIARLQNEIDKLENDLSTNYNQISLLELKIIAKDEQIDELKAQLAQANLSDSEQLALLKEELAQLRRESSDKSDEIARLNIEIRKLENKLAGEIPGISLPSFINLSGEEKFPFNIGEAIVSDDFKQYIIDDIVEQILSHKSEYGANIVEVIGHTDELPIARGSSNFDNEILEAYKGTLPVDNLKPADNAGLGIARAVAVIKILESIDELSGLTFVPLSGGQLILPNDGFIRGNLSGDVKERRRIEIRVRRSADSNYVGN